MPVNQCMDGQVSFWVLWRIVLNPVAPTKVLLSVDGCQIIVGEGIQEGVLFSSVADITPRSSLILDF